MANWTITASQPCKPYIFFTGNCQLGKTYQEDYSDASSQEEGEKELIFCGGVYFPDECFHLEHSISRERAEEMTKEMHKSMYNQWIRPDCEHTQNMAAAT